MGWNYPVRVGYRAGAAVDLVDGSVLKGCGPGRRTGQDEEVRGGSGIGLDVCSSTAPNEWGSWVEGRAGQGREG